MGLKQWAAALMVGAALLSTAAWPADVVRLFPELEKAGFVTEGATAPQSVLYVFFDANCYYCNLTWKALQQYERVGLQVRWVPVAYQKPSSTGRAAAIMEAPDPAAALRDNELGYRPQTYDGGIKPLAQARPATARTLRANLALMKRFGALGTPAVVWKDAGGKVDFRNAVPRLSELPRITGLPEQRIDDPELAEFR
jgi:thiol:disulfide interchange protein DsbG